LVPDSQGGPVEGQRIGLATIAVKLRLEQQAREGWLARVTVDEGDQREVGVSQRSGVAGIGELGLDLEPEVGRVGGSTEEAGEFESAATSAEDRYEGLVKLGGHLAIFGGRIAGNQ
jgi:hypothetical protein